MHFLCVLVYIHLFKLTIKYTKIVSIPLPNCDLWTSLRPIRFFQKKTGKETILRLKMYLYEAISNNFFRWLKIKKQFSLNVNKCIEHRCVNQYIYYTYIGKILRLFHSVKNAAKNCKMVSIDEASRHGRPFLTKIFRC